MVHRVLLFRLGPCQRVLVDFCSGDVVILVVSHDVVLVVIHDEVTSVLGMLIVDGPLEVIVLEVTTAVEILAAIS